MTSRPLPQTLAVNGAAECAALGVGYERPEDVGREIEGAQADTIEDDRLVVHNAGSVLWRYRSTNEASACTAQA